MSEIVWSDELSSPAKEIFSGIYVRQLWQSPTGAQAVIVEIAAGSKWQGVDFHQDNSEEVLVMSGIFNDGTRDYPPGTFIHHPIGSSHIPQSHTGCKLFIFYPEKQ